VNRVGNVCNKRGHNSGKRSRPHDADRRPTIKQAMQRPDWDKFQCAIETEMRQLREEGVYDGTSIDASQLPPGANLVGSMFTLTVKRDANTGKIDKYKARLVALGNQQKA